MSAKFRSKSLKPTVASLFSGCGGFDLGFHQEGFRPVAAFDLDPHVVGIYNDNIAHVATVCDLSIKMPEIRADVLLAGSPCQGFSTSGKRDLDDPRNDLLIRAARIALRTKPSVFVLENVPAAISGPHGTRWQRVEEMLKGGGYRVLRLFVEGPNCGIAQVRKRLFLVAARKGLPDVISLPTIAPPTLASVLKGVSDLSGHQPIAMVRGSREYLIASRIKQGQKLCNVRVSPNAVPTWEIPEVFGKINNSEREVLQSIVRLRRRDRRRDFGDADPVLQSAIDKYIGRSTATFVERLLQKNYLRKVGRFVDLRHTYNGKFRRLSVEQLSPTVDTHFGDPLLFVHPTENRGLTPREAARLHGFGDEFKISGSRARAFRMIGNAVPPPMAAQLARFIRSQVLQK